MSYMFEDMQREDELVRNARESILKFGLGRAMTDDEIEKRNKKLRRNRKRNAFFESVLSGVKTIVCTPLSIAFHAVSFVTRGIGFISAFGMLLGGYYVYQGFVAAGNGAAFGEIVFFQKAVPYFIFPFIAYGISVVTERIYLFFKDNAF